MSLYHCVTCYFDSLRWQVLFILLDCITWWLWKLGYNSIFALMKCNNIISISWISHCAITTCIYVQHFILLHLLHYFFIYFGLVYSSCVTLCCTVFLMNQPGVALLIVKGFLLFVHCDYWYTQNPLVCFLIHMQRKKERRNGRVPWPFLSTGQQKTSSTAKLEKWIGTKAHLSSGQLRSSNSISHKTTNTRN